MRSKQILEAWTNETRTDLVSNYKRLKLKASGRWEASLRSEVKETPKGLRATIYSEDYTEYMQNGRRANHDQSKKAIKAWVGWAGSTFLAQWVKDKKIAANPFAVAWKIARKGIQVPNRYNLGGLVSDVVNKKSLRELGEKLIFTKVESFKSEIRKIF